MAQTKYIRNNTNRPLIIGDMGLEIPARQTIEILSLKMLETIALSSDAERLIESGKITVFDEQVQPLRNTTTAKKALKISTKDDSGENVTVDGTTTYSTISADQSTVITSAAAFSTALASAANTTIFLAEGVYEFAAPVDFTNKNNVKIIGAGRDTTYITFSGAGGGTLDKPMVDMSGSTYCGLAELTIVYNIGASNNASCGLLIGRASGNAFSGGHEFHNIGIDGYYKKASLINVASDQNRWYACGFSNYGTQSAGSAVYICTTAPSGIGALQSLGTGSIKGEYFLNCSAARQPLGIYGSDNGIYIEGGTIHDVVWKGAGMSMSEIPTAYTWSFDSATTSGPGSGELRFDNATLTSVTNIYIHDTDKGGTDRDSVLDALIAGGNLRLYNDADLADYFSADITSVTDSGTYHTIGVNNIKSGGAFSDADTLSISFTMQKAGIEIRALATNDLKNLTFHHTRPEANGVKSMFHLTAADASGAVYGLNITGNTYVYGERFVSADDNITIRNSRIWGTHSAGTQTVHWGYGADGISYAANGTRASFDVAKVVNCEVDIIGAQYDRGDGAGKAQFAYLPIYYYNVRTTSTNSRYIEIVPIRTSGASPFPATLVTGVPAAGQIITRS